MFGNVQNLCMIHHLTAIIDDSPLSNDFTKPFSTSARLSQHPAEFCFMDSRLASRPADKITLSSEISSRTAGSDDE